MILVERLSLSVTVTPPPPFIVLQSFHVLHFLSLVCEPDEDEDISHSHFFEQRQIERIEGPMTSATQLKKDVKKIIKKPKTLRLESNSGLTTSRNKKVQFNTLPEFSTRKNRKGVLFFGELNNESSSELEYTQDRESNSADSPVQCEHDGRMKSAKGKLVFNVEINGAAMAMNNNLKLTKTK